MADSYYVPDGEHFISTEWARGPWDPKCQHAGPPAALVGRAMEKVDADEGWQTTRFTLEILRAIPLAPLTVSAEIVRPGKRVRLLRGSISAEGREVATSAAWQMRFSESEDIGRPSFPHAKPSALKDAEICHPIWEPSYLGSLEWRAVSGGFWTTGPGIVWARMRYPLLPDEAPSPLTRVLVIADSGNGVSAVLPMATALYINTELTVHLVRPLEGEWICLDAQTFIGGQGVGLAASDLWDESGWIGRGAQSLLIGSR